MDGIVASLILSSHHTFIEPEKEFLPLRSVVPMGDLDNFDFVRFFFTLFTRFLYLRFHNFKNVPFFYKRCM